MSNEILTAPTFEGAPTMDELNSGDSSWFVPDEALPCYLGLAAEMSWRDLASAGEWTSIQSGLVESLRQAAWLSSGDWLSALDSGKRGVFPSDVPKSRLAAFAVHDRARDEAIKLVKSSVQSAVNRAVLHAASVCMVCRSGVRTHDSGEFAGLCGDCVAAARFLRVQSDEASASERVGGKKWTRGELVSAYLNTQLRS
jgi:hypothetical protein